MISPRAISIRRPVWIAAACLWLAGATAAVAELKGSDAPTPTPLAFDPGPTLDRGLAYLRDGLDDQPAALGFGYFLHRRFGVGQFADGAARYDAALATLDTEKSPEKGGVRLFRRMVAVDNPFVEEDVTALRADWDRVSVRALYCDRAPLPPDYGAALTREASRGGYHLTHAAMALMWMRDNGCPWPVDDATVEEWVAALAQQIAGSGPEDVSYEAAGVLYYLGYGDRVPAGFAEKIRDAQNADGGWALDTDRPESHWHPTLLALWALLEEFASAKLDTSVPQPGGPAPPPSPSPVPAEAKVSPPAEWTEMIEAENRLLALAPNLGPLATAVRNLSLPGDRLRPLFAETVRVTDVEGPGAPTPWIPGLSARRRAFPTADPASKSREPLELWRPLLDRVAFFDNAAFHMVRGTYPEGRRDRFDTEVSFDARARLHGGATGWARATIGIVWQNRAGSDDWRIAEWHTTELELIETPTTFFQEVLADTLRDDRLVTQARFSGHEEEVRDYLAHPERKGNDFFPPAMDEHPGLAVVDLDRDGFDDLYVMPHWGKNLMLRNRGDGSFEEIGARVGLDVDGRTAAAIFADFDNDGDADAMLARTDRPSLYLRNDGGRFHDASKDVDGGLPALASSVTTSDVDGDGLLDVYFATYAVHRLTSEFFAKESRPGRLLGDFVAPETSAALRERLETRVEIYDFPGPPNVLLRNTGEGRFRVEANSPLAAFANTYQATWADYDDDGDPDVYLANDFAPNHLFRNVGGGRFEDVTAETGTADVGFGMGATWGDVDGDGLQDLYVSNMFSKAGRRITARFESIDPRVPKMARGNTLFRNEKERFRDLSTEPGARRGQKAGWSWGGQFVDADNDAALDLYVLSGYYTAPREFELPVDT